MNTANFEFIVKFHLVSVPDKKYTLGIGGTWLINVGAAHLLGELLMACVKWHTENVGPITIDGDVELDFISLVNKKENSIIRP